MSWQREHDGLRFSNDLLIAEILLAEAAAKINGKTDPADEATDSSTATDKTPPPTKSPD